MKKNILVPLLLVVVQLQAQQVFPRYQREDHNHIMDDAYWKLWNPAVQARIDADIDANRKADAHLLLDLPVGTEISVEQLSHDFIFGAHIFNFNQLGTHERNERYKDVFGSLFNSATIAFYWKKFETEPNRLRFAEEYWDTEDYWNHCQDPKHQPHWRRPSADAVVKFCESKGIRMHGHTIIWGNRKWQHPDWIYDVAASGHERDFLDRIMVERATLENYKDGDKFSSAYEQMSAQALSDSLPEYAEALRRLFAQRVASLAKHYGGRLHSWDVVNESSVDFPNMNPGGKLMKSVYGIMPADYTYEAFQVAQREFPNEVMLNINDYNKDQRYLDQVKNLSERNCKIDIMGAQMHLFNPQQCLDIANGAQIQTPSQVWEWSERLGKAGKPIHLSEITITAPGDDLKGRQIQAIIAQNLYRLWFSIGPMMGITWWNVVDDCGAPGEPSVSGLFDRDMKPKASYFALDNLINHEWKTRLKVKIGKNGVVRFRGFRGKYKVSWTDAEGNQVSREFYLKNDGDGLK